MTQDAYNSREALQQAGQRRDLLFDLIRQQRLAEDERAVMQTASDLTGAYFGADRTGFLQWPDASAWVFLDGWTVGRVPKLEGTFPAAAVGSALDSLKAGEVLVFSDCRTDPRVSDSIFPEIGNIACIGVPVIRQGRWRAGFYVNDYVPRTWVDDDVALMSEIAELTWDAVERLRAQAALRQAKDDLEQQVLTRTRELDRAWRLSQELLAIARPDGTIEAINPRWTDLLGWEPDEIVGRPFVEFTHPDDLAATQAAFAGIFERPLTTPYEYRFRHKDGSYRWFGWTGTFEDDRFYASGHDITERRVIEEALRQSQKMEAVGQLTGGLAHDFNNLLAGISGSLELMGIRIQQGRLTDVGRFLTAAQGAAKRAAALTHRLLAFSRRQTLDPKPTDVNRLVMEIHDMIQRTVGPAIPVEVVGATGLWPALVDQSQLENALLNLCINARDAMPDGGRITVETANRWMDGRAARQHDMPEGQYLAMSVTDTGTGMPPEVIARVFEPFFTTKPIGEGTGLGLSMIYGFAQQSGGQVRIYSEVGKGTTVTIYLPRHHGEVEDELAAKAAKLLGRAEQGETVLVVDDEPTVRMLVTDILDELGYATIEATDSAAGLKVLQSDVRIDLLVTDVGLPGGMNGRQMADAARAHRPSLQVLFITGYAENSVVGNGHLLPGMAVLTKPFAMAAMAARIRSMIEVTRIASPTRRT